MGARVKLSEEHPVDVVHRISAGILGAGLWVFAALGFINSGGFFSTQGTTVFGLSNNGALSALSVVAGLVLLLSAVWGGRLASAALTVMGVLFLLSGLVHLAILHTGLNILAFRLPNVFFSLIVGTLLSVLGLYGRASGGLPPDNPYRRMAPRRRRRPSPSEQLTAADQESPRLERAEQAMGEGTASPQQENMVRQDQTRRRAEEFNRAYRHLAERRGGDAGAR